MEGRGSDDKKSKTEEEVGYFNWMEVHKGRRLYDSLTLLVNIFRN